MNYVSATTCNQLAGSKQYLCYYQNRYCPATNGTNCEPVDQLQACSSFDIITYSRLTCSALTNQVECTAGFQTFGPYLTLLLKNEMTKYFDSKKCSWMFLEFQNTCEDYSPSTQNYLNCYPFNRGTYNWDNKDVKHGSCVPCFQELLIVTILISMII
ncbi:unnamed protein product [Paramecium octaurelia]|uniref:Uncharacterized protein n=1 Tax=Paramecium octaurelia TaxID=43137 RepID=A0A8S1YKT9_PAROT|nr:unnamed protein product [Paramecium octaurelia]